MNERLLFVQDTSPDISPAAHLAAILCDDRLSWKAKSILLFMIGVPWQVAPHFTTADLITFGTESEDEVRSAFFELQKLGYASLSKTQANGWIFTFTDHAKSHAVPCGTTNQ